MGGQQCGCSRGGGRAGGWVGGWATYQSTFAWAADLHPTCRTKHLWCAVYWSQKVSLYVVVWAAGAVPVRAHRACEQQRISRRHGAMLRGKHNVVASTMQHEPRHRHLSAVYASKEGVSIKM